MSELNHYKRESIKQYVKAVQSHGELSAVEVTEIIRALSYEYPEVSACELSEEVGKHLV